MLRPEAEVELWIYCCVTSGVIRTKVSGFRANTTLRVVATQSDCSAVVASARSFLMILMDSEA